MNTMVCEDFADGKRWEMALIIQLVVSPALYSAVQDFGGGLRLDVEDFAWTPCRCIYEALQGYYAAYTDQPTVEMIGLAAGEIANARKSGATTPPLIPEEMAHLRQILTAAQTTPSAPGEFYAEKVHKFVLMRRIQRLTSEYGPAMDRGVGGAEFVQEVSKLKDTGVSTRRFGYDRTENLEHPLTAEHERRISTGIGGLNRCINGGLAVGELGVVIGLTGIGKSNTLVQFAVAAAESGWHALMITLEMATQEIKARANAMHGHIRGSTINKPLISWSPEDIERLRQVIEHPIYSKSLAYEELAGKERTIATLDLAIAGWLDAEQQLFGSTSKAGVVCVDYLDKLAENAPRIGKNENDWTVFERLSDQLRGLAQKHKVAIWTAIQSTTSAMKAKTLRMDHASGGLAKLKPTDVVLGLQLTHESQRAEEDALKENAGETDMDRTMEVTVLKNRKGIKRKISVYQGYDLRLWDSKSSFQHAISMADEPFRARTLFVNKAQGGNPA